MPVIWIIWLWFIPFGATMDTRIMTVPVHQRPLPEYHTKDECETAKNTLVPQLASMWPDPKANLEEIRVYCLPEHVK